LRWLAGPGAALRDGHEPVHADVLQIVEVRADIRKLPSPLLRYSVFGEGGYPEGLCTWEYLREHV